MGKYHVKFHYTPATIYAIIAAGLTLAVTFGFHMSQDNIKSILELVGLILGVTVAGAGTKSAGMIRAGVLTGTTGLRFTTATVVAIVGAIIAIAVSFGFDVSQTNIKAILTLVGLLASGIIVGGAQKSHAALVAGTHPMLQGMPGRGTVKEPATRR